ncbi:MAG: hypothetical protein AAFY41_13695, partial [Bacteroidota bacterium]
ILMSPLNEGLINILPQSTITKMGANHWKKTAMSTEFGFLVLETDSMENAEKLASEVIEEKILL